MSTKMTYKQAKQMFKVGTNVETISGERGTVITIDEHYSHRAAVMVCKRSDGTSFGTFATEIARIEVAVKEVLYYTMHTDELLAA